VASLSRVIALDRQEWPARERAKPLAIFERETPDSIFQSGSSVLRSASAASVHAPAFEQSIDLTRFAHPADC
jgi:hypothetical protein